MDIFDELRDTVSGLQAQNELLQESLAQRALALEDVGWKKLTGYDEDDDGITLESLKKLSDKLRELAAAHPLHIRGAQLRHAYVFGRGMDFVNLKASARTIVDDPRNKAVLFSMDAYERANLAMFTDGNFFVLRNTKTNNFINVPMSQITGRVTNPDDSSDIWFVQRTWTVNKESRVVWYPTGRRQRIKEPLPSGISDGTLNVPVSQDTVIYVKRSKTQSGWTWGIPDSLGAMIYTHGYDQYIHKGLELHTALSTFAWNLTRKTSSGVDKAAAQIHQPGGAGVGGTAIGTGDAVSSVGVPSAQVNFNNGQPVAALVAACFGVPVIALLSSPGATGGSYGAAQTLDSPTLKGFEAIQDSWADFYHEIFFDLGSKDGRAEFASIETDAPYRQITSITTAVELGVLWRDEARVAILDILDVTKMHDELPELPDYPDKSGTLVAKQGVQASGVIGDTTNPQGDTNHDGDTSL